MIYNMFTDRVDTFNSDNENKRLAELFSTEKEQQEAEWESFSIEEVQQLLTLTEEEARKLVKSGLFKTYRVGNEYRASKKSVAENVKTVEAMMTYQNKKSMTVADLRRILGLGKTAAYRLINQCYFKTYLVFGKMRIDVQSFEEWYVGQFHYKKVNGERPGLKYGKTIGPVAIAKMLDIPKSTARDLMLDGNFEYITVEGKRRVIEESFDKWYASQTKYKKVYEIEEVENYVD